MEKSLKQCPRCKKEHFSTTIVSRYSYKMPINKCLVCSFLWIFDEDLQGLAKAESKKMFIETLRNLGSNGTKRGKDS